MKTGYLVLAIVAALVVLSATRPDRTMSVTASAYNSTEAQTDDTPNEGAWGDRIMPGMQIVAVSPDLIEAGLTRGAELRIEGLPGVWTVLDRTASRHRNRIDIYMGEDVEAAIKWGLKKVTIRWSTPASQNSRP